MKTLALLEVLDRTGDVGTTGPCYHATAVRQADSREFGGWGVTPLEAVAEVFRHMGNLSQAEYVWEGKRKGFEP